MILRSGRIIGRAGVDAGHPPDAPNISSPRVDEGTARSTNRCAPPFRSTPIVAIHRRSPIAVAPPADPILRACRRHHYPTRPTLCSAHRYRLNRCSAKPVAMPTTVHNPIYGPQAAPTSAKNSTDRSGQFRKSATAAAAVAPTASATVSATVTHVTTFGANTDSGLDPEPDPDPDPKPSQEPDSVYLHLAWPPFTLLPFRHPEGGPERGIRATPPVP